MDVPDRQRKSSSSEPEKIIRKAIFSYDGACRSIQLRRVQSLSVEGSINGEHIQRKKLFGVTMLLVCSFIPKISNHVLYAKS